MSRHNAKGLLLVCVTVAAAVGLAYTAVVAEETTSRSAATRRGGVLAAPDASALPLPAPRAGLGRNATSAQDMTLRVAQTPIEAALPSSTAQSAAITSMTDRVQIRKVAPPTAAAPLTAAAPATTLARPAPAGQSPAVEPIPKPDPSVQTPASPVQAGTPTPIIPVLPPLGSSPSSIAAQPLTAAQAAAFAAQAGISSAQAGTSSTQEGKQALPEPEAVAPIPTDGPSVVDQPRLQPEAGAFADGAPEETEAVDPDQYRVGVDDVIEIGILQPEQLLTTVTVSPDGYITFPYIGSLRVKGRTLAEMQEAITRRLSDGYMRYPVVTVALQESRSRKFFVYGEVAKPGGYPMESQMTVLRAISVGGGFTKYSNTSKVKVLRPNVGSPGYLAVNVNIKAVMNGNSTEDLLLEPGDMVVVSEGMF